MSNHTYAETAKEHVHEFAAGAITAPLHTAIVVGTGGFGMVFYATKEMPYPLRHKNRHPTTFKLGVAFSIAAMVGGLAALSRHFNPENGKQVDIENKDWGVITQISNCFQPEERGNRSVFCDAETTKYTLKKLDLALFPGSYLSAGDRILKQTVWYENVHEISYCSQKPGEKTYCVLSDRNRGGRPLPSQDKKKPKPGNGG